MYIIFYIFTMMKNTNYWTTFRLQVLPSLFAGVLLIVIMATQLNRPSATIPYIYILTVYVEYLLSFIASLVLLYWMLVPFVYYFIRGNSGGADTTVNVRGYLFLFVYAIVAIILSPFGLLSIRFFLQDENYVKYISITTIVSTFVVLYFTFRAAFR